MEGGLGEEPHANRAHILPRVQGRGGRSQKIGALLPAPPGRAGFLKQETTVRVSWLKEQIGLKHLEYYKGRIDIELAMWGHPRPWRSADLVQAGRRLQADVQLEGRLEPPSGVGSQHSRYAMPIGLFVPYETAWKAVKEFIETDGELPKSIEWIANRDLPPEYLSRSVTR